MNLNHYHCQALLTDWVKPSALLQQCVVFLYVLLLLAGACILIHCMFWQR